MWFPGGNLCSRTVPAARSYTNGQVTVFVFPPNVTAVYQPMDQGIIATLKTGYKSRLLSQLVQTVGDNELQALAKQLPSGTAGLAYGCPPHVGDAIILVKESWDAISSSTIAACWDHAHCLSGIEAAGLAMEFREYCKTVQSDTVQIMCERLASLTIGNTDHFKNTGLDVVVKAAHSQPSTASSMLLEWLQLEDIGAIPVDEEDVSEADGDESIDPQNKENLVSRALLLLQDLHGLAAKLRNAQLMDATRQFVVDLSNADSANA